MGRKNSLEIIYLGGKKNSLKISESYWEDLLNLQVFHMFAWTPQKPAVMGEDLKLHELFIKMWGRQNRVGVHGCYFNFRNILFLVEGTLC